MKLTRLPPSSRSSGRAAAAEKPFRRRFAQMNADGKCLRGSTEKAMTRATALKPRSTGPSILMPEQQVCLLSLWPAFAKMHAERGSVPAWRRASGCACFFGRWSLALVLAPSSSRLKCSRSVCLHPTLWKCQNRRNCQNWRLKNPRNRRHRASSAEWCHRSPISSSIQ